MTDDTELTPSNWARLDGLLDQALELSGAEQRVFVEQVEPPLRSRLRTLLAQSGSDQLEELVGDSVSSALQRLADTSREAPFQVGRWQLKHRLGSGGMAQVYYAERLEEAYTQRAAVKILLPFREGEDFIARFVRERRILASIDHPNVARFLDGGMLEGGRPWLAMEYVEGTTVIEYCRTHELSVRRRLELFLQICDAVQAAHGRLIVHRDIKPDNILVDQSGRARLLDFGIAKILDDVDYGHDTRTGNCLLTLRYASPEQVTNAFVTVASDVYQLGLLLYEMLTDQQPFDHRGKSLDEVVRTICEVAPTRPSRRGHGIGRDLDEIVLHTLSKDPKLRYRAVTDFAQDVQRYLEGRPVAARAPSRWYFLQRFVRRNAALVSVVAISMIALAGATVFSVDRARKATEAASRSEAVKQILFSFFGEADPFGTSQGDITIADALANRLPELESIATDDPSLGVEVYLLLGEVYESLSMHGEALSVFRKAYDEAVGHPSVSESDRDIAYASVGRSLRNTGDLQGVLAHFANRIGDQPRGPEAYGAWFSSQLALAQTHQRLGNADAVGDVVDQLDRAIERFGLTDSTRHTTLSGLKGYLARSRGDHESALSFAREAVAHARASGKTAHLAAVLNNLALALARLGRYEEAEPVLIEAIDTTERVAPDHPLRGFHTLNYAGLLFRTGRQNEAVDLAMEGIALMGNVDKPQWIFSAHRDLATYAFRIGRVDVVLPALATQIETAEQLFGPDSLQTASAQVVLARYAHFAGYTDVAIAIMSQLRAKHDVISRVDPNLELARLHLDIGNHDAAASMLAASPRSDSAVGWEIKLRRACASDDVVRVAALRDEALRRFEDDTAEQLRLRLWAGLVATAAEAGGGTQSDHAVGRAATRIADAAVELDILDEWRLTQALMSIAIDAGADIPERPRERAAALHAIRQTAAEQFASDDRIGALLQRRYGTTIPDAAPASTSVAPFCTTLSSLRGVSRRGRPGEWTHGGFAAGEEGQAIRRMAVSSQTKKPCGECRPPVLWPSQSGRLRTLAER